MCRIQHNMANRASYHRNSAERLKTHKARKERLRAAGMCLCCGQHLAVTGTLCFDCAAKLDERNTARI
jgi:hypothetical protein